jgi:hypothetical protein
LAPYDAVYPALAASVLSLLIISLLTPAPSRAQLAKLEPVETTT